MLFFVDLPRIRKLTIRRGQSNFSIVYIPVSCQEKGYYRVVGQLSFVCFSYCGRTRRLQGPELGDGRSFQCSGPAGARINVNFSFSSHFWVNVNFSAFCFYGLSFSNLNFCTISRWTTFEHGQRNSLANF